jgi:hypothetical protein
VVPTDTDSGGVVGEIAGNSRALTSSSERCPKLRVCRACFRVDMAEQFCQIQAIGQETFGGMKRRQQGPADRGPADPVFTVALAIREIDWSDTESREVLLADLLCAAWPSSAAQDQ